MELTKAQFDMLDRLVTFGEIIVGGTDLNVVKALERRGLVVISHGYVVKITEQGKAVIANAPIAIERVVRDLDKRVPFETLTEEAFLELQKLTLEERELLQMSVESLLQRFEGHWAVLKRLDLELQQRPKMTVVT